MKGIVVRETGRSPSVAFPGLVITRDQITYGSSLAANTTATATATANATANATATANANATATATATATANSRVNVRRLVTPSILGHYCDLVRLQGHVQQEIKQTINSHRITTTFYLTTLKQLLSMRSITMQLVIVDDAGG